MTAAIQGWLWAISLAAMAYGAWSDLKTRTVPNKAWTRTAMLATPLLVWELFTAPLAFLIRLATALPFAAIVLVLWRTKSFGGADAKAFILLAVLLSPVGYYAPSAARIYPALDILVPSLLANEAWRRITRSPATPLMVPIAASTALAAMFGGVLWWPFVWLSRLIV